jgi:hypothetical protein
MSSFQSSSNPQAGSNPQSGPSSPTGSNPQNLDNSEWVEHYDKVVDASYYYNPKTGEASWVKPNTDTYTKNFELQFSDQEPLSEVEQLNNKVEVYSAELSKVRNELNDCKKDCNSKHCDNKTIIAPKSMRVNHLLAPTSWISKDSGKSKLPHIGGMRTRKKRRAVVKQTKSRRKFNNRTKNKK